MVDDASAKGQTAPARGALATALALVLLQTFAFFVPPATWAPMSRFGLTHALVETGGLTLGDWHAATGDRSFRDGEWYSDKAPLTAILATAPYAAVRLAQRVLSLPPPAFVARAYGDVPAARVYLNVSAQRLLYASSLGVSGMAGVLVGVITLLWLRRRFDLAQSMFGASAIVLATPIFPYSTSLLGHVPAAACLLGALYLGEPHAPRRRLIVAGTLLAIAVGCEYLSAVPAAIIGLYLAAATEAEGAHQSRLSAGARAVGRLALGATPVVLLIGAYHHMAFGAFYLTGYAHLTDETFRAGHQEGLLGVSLPTAEGLLGLTFGARRGLFYVSPLLALSVGATLWRWRRLDGAVRVYLLGFVAMLAANAGYYMWWGGAATGPRHIVPVLPALAPGLAIAWSWVRARPLTLALAIWSVLTMLAFAAVGIEASERGETVFRYAWSRLADGRVAALSSASNLGLILGFPSLTSLVPLWLVWVFGGRWIWRLTSAAEQPAEAAPSPPNERAPGEPASGVQ